MQVIIGRRLTACLWPWCRALEQLDEKGIDVDDLGDDEWGERLKEVKRKKQAESGKEFNWEVRPGRWCHGWLAYAWC